MILKFLPALGFLGLVLSGGAYAAVTHYTNLSGRVVTLEQANKRLTSRLAGAEMRVERRNNAIQALDPKCRDKAQEYVKTGNIPVFRNPFDDLYNP
jgi:hypothetical protein